MVQNSTVILIFLTFHDTVEFGFYFIDRGHAVRAILCGPLAHIFLTGNVTHKALALAITTFMVLIDHRFILVQRKVYLVILDVDKLSLSRRWRSTQIFFVYHGCWHHPCRCSSRGTEKLKWTEIKMMNKKKALPTNTRAFLSLSETS